MKQYPVTRQGWADHYAQIYNKTGRSTAEHLALWFLLLKEAFGERPSIQKPKPIKDLGDFYTGRG